MLMWPYVWTRKRRAGCWLLSTESLAADLVASGLWTAIGTFEDGGPGITLR